MNDVPPAAAPQAAETKWLKYVLIGCGALALLGMVIVGIAIVAAVVIPQLAMNGESARDAAARSELGDVILAQELYKLENGTYTMHLADLDFPDTAEVTTTITRADAFAYSICSQHADADYGWRVDSEVGMVLNAGGGC